MERSSIQANAHIHSEGVQLETMLRVKQIKKEK